MLEIDHQADLDPWLQSGAGRPPAAVQGLDLAHLGPDELSGSLEGSLFLGCEGAGSQLQARIVALGGVVIPAMEGFAFSTHRARLYRVEELFAGFDPSQPDGYRASADYRIYAQYLEQGKDSPGSIRTSLARRLHDHSITDALKESLAGRQVVAVMGGHGMQRSEPFYAAVARLSRELTIRGYLLVSGGGPGAMEATHLGAYFAARPPADLEAAIEILAVRPAGAEGGEYADPDWLHRAWRVLEAFPIPEGREPDCLSIGIPTWLYGHEPPAPFATRIAKYFANSVREDGLLAIASHGVIFAPGSAGTTQEIFQDATQNHYGTTGYSSPMILFGKQHWTETRPVWPLLEAVSRDRPYGQLVALTDDEQEVLGLIEAYDPDEHRAT